MAKSWITEIVNTSDTTFYMWARDSTHYGKFYDIDTGELVGSNEPKYYNVGKRRTTQYDVLEIPTGAQFRGDGAGVAWYADGKNYRAISTKKQGVKNALLLWQTTLYKFDGITMMHGDDRKAFAHLKADASDNAFLLSISGKSPNFEIDLELRRTDNTEKVVFDVLKQIVIDEYEDYRKVRVEAGKAAAKALIAAG